MCISMGIRMVRIHVNTYHHSIPEHGGRLQAPVSPDSSKSRDHHIEQQTHSPATDRTLSALT